SRLLPLVAGAAVAARTNGSVVGVGLALGLGLAATDASRLIASLWVVLRGGGFFCGCAIELPSAFSNSPSERASSTPLIIKNPEIDNVRINRARYWFMR